MKKQLLLLLFSVGLYFSSLCQDILVLKNGDEIKVKISEVLPDMVKYKKWDNQDGPMYSESKTNIFMIKYQNGSKDVFTNQSSSNTNSPTVSTEDAQKNEALKKLENYVNKTYSKEGFLKTSDFKKVDGVMRNENGQSVYAVQIDFTLQFLSDG